MVSSTHKFQHLIHVPIYYSHFFKILIIVNVIEHMFNNSDQQLLSFPDLVFFFSRLSFFSLHIILVRFVLRNESIIDCQFKEKQLAAKKLAHGTEFSRDQTEESKRRRISCNNNLSYTKSPLNVHRIGRKKKKE